MKENTRYTFADLLEDDYFISSVNHPTAESESYWAALRQEGRVAEEDYELACSCVRSFRQSGRRLTTEETDNMWTNIRTTAKAARRRRLYLSSAAAAAACLFAFVGWFAFHALTPASDDGAAPVAMTIGRIEDVAPPDSASKDIRIIFSGEQRLTLKEKTAEIKYSENGEAAVNSHVVKTDAQAASYNQVIVPQGRQTQLTLSDGSKLWLNASSRVVYPPVFNDASREIYLEGEAYLEITPDAAHPFTVKTRRMEIRVLGTSFNVSAYEDEPSHTVALVTGAVAVSVKAGAQADRRIEMKPNQLFRISGTETQLHNVRIARYISWKDGLYLYQDEQLSLILKRLAHYYGVEIRFAPEVGEMRFTGKLDLKNDVERVLNGLSNTAPVRCRKEHNGHNGTFYLYTYP